MTADETAKQVKSNSYSEQSVEFLEQSEKMEQT